MLAWLRDLTSRERRTMLACWGGWTLDGFDQQLYSYVVPTVIALWGMSTGAAGTIGTVTVVTASFGGWFAGSLADLFGRVRMLLAMQRYSAFCPDEFSDKSMAPSVGRVIRSDLSAAYPKRAALARLQL
jgi:hypothetical protein